jgi:hypothetical protein
MTDLEEIFRIVDHLNPDELEQLHEYVEERRRTVTWWNVSPENIAKLETIMRPVHEEAAQMSDDDVNAAIDEAIAEVRRERKQNQSSS